MMKKELFAETFQHCFQEIAFHWKHKKWDEKSIFASVGSCFAREMTLLLSGASLDIKENPNGILYNPVSISDALQRVAEMDFYKEEELFLHEGKWHSFFHHGQFSLPDKNLALENINKEVLSFHSQLEKAHGIFITLSSAVVYEVKETEKIAANCHKLPPDVFERRLLSYKECEESCYKIIESIRKCNKEGIIVFTLSPVRHYPGEPLLNSAGKARLRSVLEDVCDGDKIVYFPAYEIVNDSLRDYRFYKEDLVHISPGAVKIIQDIFLENCFVPLIREKVRLWRKECARENHIPRKG
ncbi:MAG: GSCFA domain-containing protein [Lentisphaeria bacterium]|nr:GSCFA domain-containing protein [Lentisphaeria bacterium]